MPTAAPYLFKEHREGKKGEKTLVPVRFSRTRPENGATEACLLRLQLGEVGVPEFYLGSKSSKPGSERRFSNCGLTLSKITPASFWAIACLITRSASPLSFRPA